MAVDTSWLITDPDLPFEEHWAAAADGRLFGVEVKVAAPATLQFMLAASNEPKHREDLAILSRLLGHDPSGEYD